MWSNCDHWQTGTFDAFPDLSHRPFAHVFAHAPAELLAWVLRESSRAGLRWLYDFALYLRMRSKAEGRCLRVCVCE